MNCTGTGANCFVNSIYYFVGLNISDSFPSGVNWPTVIQGLIVAEYLFFQMFPFLELAVKEEESLLGL